MNANLTIEAALDVFLAGFSATRSFTKPYDVTQLTSSLWKLADRNSNSKTARSAEYIALDCDSDEIESSIRCDSTPKHMLCVLLRRSEGLESDVLKIKTLGYRYLGHEPFYILNTSATIPRFDYPIQRVVEAEMAEILLKASRQRLILQSHLVVGDAHCRLYAAFERDVPIGWVRCIRTQGNRAWVSLRGRVPSKKGNWKFFDECDASGRSAVRGGMERSIVQPNWSKAVPPPWLQTNRRFTAILSQEIASILFMSCYRITAASFPPHASIAFATLSGISFTLPISSCANQLKRSDSSLVFNSPEMTFASKQATKLRWTLPSG